MQGGHQAPTAGEICRMKEWPLLLQSLANNRPVKPSDTSEVMHLQSLNT